MTALRSNLLWALQKDLQGEKTWKYWSTYSFILPLVMLCHLKQLSQTSIGAWTSKACCYDAAVGYITSSLTLILGRVECGETYSILPPPLGRLHAPRLWRWIWLSHPYSDPGPCKINMQAKSHPHPPLTRLYVWAHFFLTLTQIFIFFPPRELPFLV